MLPVRSTDPAHEMALQAALDRLTGARHRDQDAPDGWVTAVRVLPARSARNVPFPPDISESLREVLRARGVEQLYSHQAVAIEHVLAGRNVVITTPTASGKTLCYNVPVLDTIVRDSSTRALYLFPTKALAQDQLAELHELTELLATHHDARIGVFTYDGDTPQDARKAIRGRAHVVLSNPDMLHSGVLPHHPRWAKLFENLRYVVIDELHAYRGVFGSHLTNVLRRLRRICRHYGSNPTFICCSATIANPRELAEGLAEQPFELVSEHGAPRGEKVFLFVNPPVVNQQLGIRRSYLAETRRIAGEFLKRGMQLIVFAQSRLATEILTTYLKDDFDPSTLRRAQGRPEPGRGATGSGSPRAWSRGDGSPGTRERIRGYRGGYLPLRRRQIEKELREGDVRAVVSTNALELGIDIGALDVCVMAGYPGTIAATWQRAGRAGRRTGRSAAVLVASSAPIDQFVVRHPSYFFDASPEHALINPDNLHILVDHVKCAAFELPFTTSEQYGRQDVQEVLGVLAESGLVHRTDGALVAGEPESVESVAGDLPPSREASASAEATADLQSLDEGWSADRRDGPPERTVQPALARRVAERPDFGGGGQVSGAEGQWQWTNESYPADAVSLRSISSDNFVVVDTTRGSDVIGETSFTSGPATLHEKAIYLLEGMLYQVERLDFNGRKAYVREIDCDYYTDAITYTKVTVLETFALADPGMHAHGEVHVSSRVVGFKKIKFYTNENIGSGELDLPEQQMHTTACWLTLPRSVMTALPYAADDRRDGVVGLSFAMRQVAQLLLMCDRHDIGISIGSGAEADDTDLTRTGYPATVTDEPRVFIYDNYPGGIGFSEPLFAMHADLLARTRDLIAGCNCEHGCPACVGPIGNTGPLAKTVAVKILELIVGGSAAPDHTGSPDPPHVRGAA